MLERNGFRRSASTSLAVRGAADHLHRRGHRAPVGRAWTVSPGFLSADLLLTICGFAVAALSDHHLRHTDAQFTGTPFAPMASRSPRIAGTLLIMELTRRVAGLALVIIAAALPPLRLYRSVPRGFLIPRGSTWHRFFSPDSYTRCRHSWAQRRPFPRPPTSSLFIIFAAFLQALEGGRLFRQFRLCGRRAARSGGRPRSRSSPRA